MLLACSPFVLLEIGLRLAGHPPIRDGVDMDPVVDLQQLKPLFELNRKTNDYEIPESRRNFFQPASFPAKKPATTRRIFVLGGSTVQGRPYAPETAFSTWLQLRLQAADPNTRFEVVNCGGVSYASYRLARVLDEVLTYQPDAIVLYTGHNEFLEDRSYAAARDFGPSQRLISRLGSKLQTVRWLRAKFASEPAAQTELPMEVNARLDHAGGLDSYHRDSDWRSGVEQHFAWTLASIVDRIATANVPLILCRPASDIVKTPPIKTESLTSQDASYHERFQSLWQIASDATQPAAERLSAAQQCLTMDDQHAGAHYIAGRLQYDQGKVVAAKTHLSAARDFDVCPLRATSPIVDAVTEIARQHQLPLIDAIALLDQRAHDGTRVPDAIADAEFFVDHVHPTIAGHQLIAKALANEFERLDWTRGGDESESRYEQLVQQHLATLGEAYYARGKQRLEGLQRWATGRAGQLGIDETLSPEFAPSSDPAPE